jgi:hypothetical protein
VDVVTSPDCGADYVLVFVYGVDEEILAALVSFDCEGEGAELIGTHPLCLPQRESFPGHWELGLDGVLSREWLAEGSAELGVSPPIHLHVEVVVKEGEQPRCWWL